MKDLYIIDGTGYVYRSYFAIDSMTNDRGDSTNALFGFVRSIQKLIKDFGPENMVVVFDGPRGSELRKAIYPEYKANRAAAPDDLRYQTDWAEQFCVLAGIPVLVLSDVEADDTIGSLAKWAGGQGTDVYVCTSDKDMLQLVNGHVKILQTFKDNLVFDHDKVVEKYGVAPEQIIDWLALTGDASDNVPGLPGFGPKTATTLLQKLGSLENILANPDEVPGKKKQETIREQADLARLSQDLVTIRTDLDVPLDPKFFALRKPNTQELKTFFLDKSFISFVREMEQGNGEDEQLSYHLVNDELAFGDLLGRLEKASCVAFDTETTGLDPLQASLVGIGFCMKRGEAWYVPMNGDLFPERILQQLKPIFEDPKRAFFAHNAKYDLHVMQQAGIEIANVDFDTMIASYLLNSHSHRHSLDYLALAQFGKVKTPTEALIGKGKKQITMDQVPVRTVSDYCCEDVDYTWRLREAFEPDLKTRKLDQLFTDLEMPLLRVLEHMEARGIYLDTTVLEAMAKDLKAKLRVLEDKIHDYAGETFNINSPKQLGSILFEKLGIHPPKKTKTGYSTNAEVLEQLREEHPIAEAVLEYRTLEKLRSTYAEALPEQVNPSTQRIHCTFNQSVAATGRLSSQDPNLQNIPVRTEEGRQIREAFRPQEADWSFVGADYSQIELRLLAHLSEDPELLRAFAEGEDIHRFTASLVLGIPLEEVSKEQRYHAKAVNFGIVYGQQAFGLARQLGIGVDEAKRFIDTYFQRYPKVQAFMEQCKEQARASKKALSLTGRERLIPDINSSNANLRAAAERLAINTPLQGSAADLIKMAMLQVEENLRLEKLQARLILQIHDELIVECPDEEIEQVKTLLRETLENVLTLKVPLLVDVHVGKNWKEC